MFKVQVDFKNLLYSLENLEFDNITEGLIAKHYLELIEKDVDKFFEIVKDKISEPLPKSLRGKKRPSNRLWNYLVSGEMYEGFSKKLELSKINDKKYRIELEIENKSSHSYFTNRGTKKQEGKWIGWFDDITSGDGRDNVRSMNDRLSKLFRDSIFNELILRYTTTRIRIPRR